MYIIEGTIGAGKSTLLKIIQHQLPHIRIALEPVNDWQKQIDGQSLLSHFYQDPHRWAYAFEMFTLMSRTRLYHQLTGSTSDDALLIFERSIYSGYHCFAQNSYHNGFLTDIEWQMYQEWFAFLVDEICTPPQGFIYLRVDPDMASKRIAKRNRSAEAGISTVYLQQLHDLHEQMFISRSTHIPSINQIPVLTIECDEEFESDSDRQAQLIEKIQSFTRSKTSSTRENGRYSPTPAMD